MSLTLGAVLGAGRKLWGRRPMGFEHIVTCAQVIVGDLARQVRNLKETGHCDRDEIAKELGNLIVSAIRWADDLELDPENCVNRALEAQAAYTREHR